MRGTAHVQASGYRGGQATQSGDNPRSLGITVIEGVCSLSRGTGEASYGRDTYLQNAADAITTLAVGGLRKRLMDRIMLVIGGKA